MEKQPNFIIFMTDQQRTTHLFPEFPEEWIEEHLPNYQYFLDNGVVFDNNICNTSPCGPSRGSIFTGQYPANNKIVDNSGTIEDEDQMRFTKILIEQGYDIFYKGKLHLNDEVTKFSQSWTQDIPAAPELAKEENAEMENLYGLKKWTSPDFGTLLAQAIPHKMKLLPLQVDQVTMIAALLLGITRSMKNKKVLFLSSRMYKRILQKIHFV
ncbi:MAG: sulfatase-like hydrolase/transferase [Crocinitomicaceae bacterium]|nr:sulfatase-like hydrolase/transferase [Crocinitomicaceae bacterium]